MFVSRGPDSTRTTARILNNACGLRVVFTASSFRFPLSPARRDPTLSARASDSPGAHTWTERGVDAGRRRERARRSLIAMRHPFLSDLAFRASAAIRHKRSTPESSFDSGNSRPRLLIPLQSHTLRRRSSWLSARDTPLARASIQRQKFISSEDSLEIL